MIVCMTMLATNNYKEVESLSLSNSRTTGDFRKWPCKVASSGVDLIRAINIRISNKNLNEFPVSSHAEIVSIFYIDLCLH